jgi:hypothetical protein
LINYRPKHTFIYRWFHLNFKVLSPHMHTKSLASFEPTYSYAFVDCRSKGNYRPQDRYYHRDQFLKSGCLCSIFTDFNRYEIELCGRWSTWGKGLASLSFFWSQILLDLWYELELKNLKRHLVLEQNGIKFMYIVKS